MQSNADSVNYVWINKTPVQPDEEGALCGVPLHYLDKAIANARKYPEAQFNIWIDKSLLDPMSQFFVASHLNIANVPNLRLRSLGEVPAYHAYRIFRQCNESTIKARVDFARLLVLEHEFETTDAARIFYADFDIEDVKINSQPIRQRMDDLGMVFGATYKLPVENSYMGFTRPNCETFLADLLSSSEDAAMKGEPCWKPLFDDLAGWAKTHGRELKDYGYKLATSTGYKLPPNRDYIDWGLNEGEYGLPHTA
jgi:hypothetical protein